MKTMAEDRQDTQLPQGRRRSPRDTNRIQIDNVQRDRMDELFFRDANIVNASLPEAASLHRVHTAPNIYTINNFLTTKEVDYFMGEAANGTFEESYVDVPDSSKVTVDPNRTSTFISFPKQQSKLISTIEQRVVNLLRLVSANNLEPLQMVRYQPDESFGIHHDMGAFDEETGRVTMPDKSTLTKRRLVTIFCYLNTLPPEAGGCTWFPKCNDLRIRPEAGKAVLFSNVTKERLPDGLTIHAGEAVVCAATTGKRSEPKRRKMTHPTMNKYGINIWVGES